MDTSGDAGQRPATSADQPLVGNEDTNETQNQLHMKPLSYSKAWKQNKFTFGRFIVYPLEEI